MEGPPTYEDDEDDRDEPRYTVDSHSAAATGSMPEEPFHERAENEDGGESHRP